MMVLKDSHDLIITVVKKGWADKIVKTTKKAGAEGATILHGRGTGIHEQKKLLGIAIEPEKEIVLTIVPKEITDLVIDSIVNQCDMNKPATGICFVIGIDKVVGIAHLLCALPQE